MQASMNKTTRCRVLHKAGNYQLINGGALFHAVSNKIYSSDFEPWPEYQNYVFLTTVCWSSCSCFDIVQILCSRETCKYSQRFSNHELPWCSYLFSVTSITDMREREKCMLQRCYQLPRLQLNEMWNDTDKGKPKHSKKRHVPVPLRPF
jgi:hypothetical protein